MNLESHYNNLGDFMELCLIISVCGRDREFYRFRYEREDEDRIKEEISKIARDTEHPRFGLAEEFVVRSYLNAKSRI